MAQPTLKETYAHLAKEGEVRIKLGFGRTLKGVPTINSVGTVTLFHNGQHVTRDEWELV